jgi:hypothetical protein
VSFLAAMIGSATEELGGALFVVVSLMRRTLSWIATVDRVAHAGTTPTVRTRVPRAHRPETDMTKVMTADVIRMSPPPTVP